MEQSETRKFLQDALETGTQSLVVSEKIVLDVSKTLISSSARFDK